MNKQMVLGLVGVLAMGLTACGGVPTSGTTPESEEQASVASALRYVQNTQTLSSEAVKALEAKQGRLFFLVHQEGAGSVAQVFTQEADLERAKGLEGQAFCISTRTKTTVYDLENYGGISLDIAKGTSIPNLGSLAIPGTWDNDISSFKGADCEYTYLYTGVNFTGSVWASKGSNFPTMGDWNNIVSSVKVDN